MGFGEIAEGMLRQIPSMTGIIGGKSWWNVGINSAIVGGYVATKFIPLYSSVSTLEYGARKLGIPTTLYDIGERIGFTDFEKRKKIRKQLGRFRVRKVRGLRYKNRYIK